MLSGVACQRRCHLRRFRSGRQRRMNNERNHETSGTCGCGDLCILVRLRRPLGEADAGGGTAALFAGTGLYLWQLKVMYGKIRRGETICWN